MSRCFPYPPPGFIRQGGLVESIKLEREGVLSKTEQKLHKKRGRKEKKKEEKQKDKSRGQAEKLKKLDDVPEVYRDDQLEKSDLTEEHGPPVCYTSDGTQNSHKRKRVTVPTRECEVDGTKIKIRFSLKKPRVSDPSISEEPVCSSSVRTVPNQEQRCTFAPLPEQIRYHVAERKESIAPVPEQNVCRVEERKERRPSSHTLAGDNKVPKIPKAVLDYKTLIEDWMPPLLQHAMNDDCDDWLLSTKPIQKPAATRTEDNDATCRASVTLYPRAHFLPEAEIYALPYTVPF